jgi:RNA-directed DNA polymerase
MKSQKRFQLEVRAVIQRHRNAPQAALIRALNPVIRGWGIYFSAGVSGRVFSKMDALIFRKLWAWAKRRHPNKGHQWVARRYWRIDSAGWRFGLEDGAKLVKLTDIRIRRHYAVRMRQSPYDGDALYWSTRMGRHPEMPKGHAWLLKQQNGACPLCGRFFQPGDKFHVLRQSGSRNGDSPRPTMLIHEHCQWLPDAKCAMTTHHVTEEPDEGKLSRPVLKTSVNGDVHA